MQCQQLPWKMEPSITLALICNPVLPRAAHLPLHLTLCTSIPEGNTKHPAHWFCSTFGVFFFLNSYASWLPRHQFSSFPNTSRPSAYFTFFWWWLTRSGGPAVTVFPCLVWQIHTVCVIKWKESSAVDRTPNKVIYSIITIAGKKQKKYSHKYLYLQYTKGFCDPPPNLIRRMCTKQPPLLLQNPVCHHFPPLKKILK